ncbi:MAG TPA: hypothetical protein VFT01_09855 [Homoserinimonas sp.]|nr:hypothetical protein [Homoserinimonas sp.]
MVAANSNRLPRPVSQPASDMIPPAPAISATATPEHRESAAIIRRPGAQVSCTMAQQAKANASTAEVVWVKSGQVNDGPYGIGQPGVHVTWDARRKNPLAMPSETAGRHHRRIGGETRMPRAAKAISPPPADTSTSATWNQLAVGMPSAPITLT